MNFACALSLRVEEIMDEIRPTPEKDEVEEWIWTEDDEGEVYEEALQRALEESNGVVGHHHRSSLFALRCSLTPPFRLTDIQAWASGNIRIGEYILIIDSDTRVPEVCRVALGLMPAAESDARAVRPSVPPRTASWTQPLSSTLLLKSLSSSTSPTS